jgi:DNA polymerase-3 subunit delta'
MAIANLAISEPVRRVLLRAVQASALPPAYLFVGPSGVGKRATALALAQSLNCLTPGEDACDHCAACQRIEKLVHPDIHLLEPQGQVIKIDQIRHLQESLSLQAYDARVKVAILDDATKLTVEAANSLLKMLEEPPDHTLFVLVCQNVGGLPATVLSRTQIVRFGLLPHDQIVALLRRQRPPQVDAERLAALSGGRPGKALGIEVSRVLEMRSQVLELLQQAQAGDTSLLLASAEQWAKRKGDHDLLFELLLSLARDLTILSAGGSTPLLMHADIQLALTSLAAGLSTPSSGELFEIVHAIQLAMTHNANPQLAFEVMLLKIGGVYERARQRDRERQQYSFA